MRDYPSFLRRPTTIGAISASFAVARTSIYLYFVTSRDLFVQLLFCNFIEKFGKKVERGIGLIEAFFERKGFFYFLIRFLTREAACHGYLEITEIIVN